MNLMAESSGKASLFERFVPVLVLLSVVLAFVVGVLWQKVSALEKGGVTTQTTQTAQTAAAPAAAVTLDTIKSLWDKNIIKFGDKDKKVLFVEVADPSCPYCHAAAGYNHSIYKSLGDSFKLVADGGPYIAPELEIKKLVDEGKAAFAWIYYPGHGNGQLGTKALYCAQDMGKFWEVHSLLMSDAGYTILNTTVQNDKTKSQLLVDFLKGAADSAELKKCIDSDKYDARLTEDQNLASGTLGVTGTPGFFVNATNFAGAYSWTDMKSAVDAALK